MVEAHFVERGRARIRSEVTTDAAVHIVGPVDHHHGVPTNPTSDVELEGLVARIFGLLFGSDRVHVRGLDELRRLHTVQTGAPQQQTEQVVGPLRPLVLDDGIE